MTDRRADRQVADKRGGFLDDPRRVRLLGIAFVVIACIASALLALAYNHSRPAEVGQAPTTVSSTFPLVLPESVAGYAREAGSASPSVGQDSSTTTARYLKDGTASVVVLLHRPATDPDSFLADAGFTSVTPGATDGACGTSSDSNGNGCAVIRGTTAILVVGLQDQDRAEMLTLTQQFAAAIAGR